MEKMNRIPYYSEEISQTALALLTLVATGKSLDKAAVQSLRLLLFNQDDFSENRVNLTIFSDHDDEDDNTEPPVIIPFASLANSANSYHNGYGALSFKNVFSSKTSVSARSVSAHKETNTQLRIYSPDSSDYQDDDDTYGMAFTAPALRLYAE